MKHPMKILEEKQPRRSGRREEKKSRKVPLRVNRKLVSSRGSLEQRPESLRYPVETQKEKAWKD